MDDDPKRFNAPPAARDGGEPAKGSQSLERDRQVDRTVDLTDEDIAAIKSSEIAPSFEHLNAEADDRQSA
ncbi:hypothetical protein JQ593_17370 [Bradyrhizobium viridifuturi]|uniref:hypothetical protein n=1 Tax=uncultured Bradyrhizobium sp. TaxID=199684 RepID=UPI001BA68F9E|nr:hypothetical protein [uncultured Bradyrhizobium sp.]MBR1040744.1 hypothetical protein [Bradyrhizobium viridifuturi]MBR1074867.1 hypothetical protein [Bradyrhizobium viridifuturi]